MGAPLSNSTRKLLLGLSCLLVVLCNSAAPLLLRLYYVKGGSRVWLQTWLQTSGFPIILILLLISYYQRRKTDGGNTKLISVSLPTFIAAAFVGAMLGGSNYLYSYAAQRLPVSTSTLILASQLVFTAFSAFILVKQKFTPYSINAIVLLTLGVAALAVHASSDRPAGETKKAYALGFAMMFVSAALSGLIFPLVELMYKKTRTALTYTMVMEIQMVMSFSSTVIATVGMLVNNDFKAIPREAREFALGEVKYYVVIVSTAIVVQLFILGAVGIVFCSSALVNGIIITVLLPVAEVLAVIFFHDKFTAEKGMSLVLCLWGFVSHVYGEYRASKKKNQIQTQESAMNTPNIAPTIELEP